MSIRLAIAVLASRALKTFLFGLSAVDPLTLIAVPSALGLVVFVASWMPARRAARVDPMAAIRQD